VQPFEYSNISFSRSVSNNLLVIRGSVTNKSNKNFSALALRIILYGKAVPILNVVIVVNGLPATRTRDFEKEVTDADYDRINNQLVNYEVFTDSAY
jgi:hypothetical protein